MPAIDVQPIVLNDITLTIDAGEYEAHVSKAQLTPTTPVQTWRGMTPTAVRNVAGSSTWVLDLTYAQDETTAASLSQYLLSNAGQVKPVTLAPVKGGPTYTISALMVPGPIGGDVDTLGTGSVSLPCDGQPLRTAA